MPDIAQAVTLAGAISTATIAAVTGAVGWISAYFLTSWRDDRTKRLQLEIERTSAQIEGFYAPLKALTDQLDATVDVLNAVLKEKDGEERHRLTGVVYKRLFLPIHEQINLILKTKAHLLEGVDPPPSFRLYFQHYSTELAYWNLKDDGEHIVGVQIPPFPSDFYHDIRDGYRVVIRRYEGVLQELRQRRSLLAQLSKMTVDKRSTP